MKTLVLAAVVIFGSFPILQIAKACPSLSGSYMCNDAGVTKKAVIKKLKYQNIDLYLASYEGSNDQVAIPINAKISFKDGTTLTGQCTSANIIETLMTSRKGYVHTIYTLETPKTLNIEYIAKFSGKMERGFIRCTRN